MTDERVPGTGAPQDVVSEDQVLLFHDGIPGFPASRRFSLLSIDPDSEFRLLQSLDEPDVAMVVTVPWGLFPDYAPELEEVDRRELGIESPDDAVVFCPVRLDAPSRRAFVNLMGPFIVNAHTRAGRQVVLAGDHPLRAVIDLGSA